MKRVLFIALLVVFACEDKSENNNDFEVVYTSINNEEVGYGLKGIIIRFSKNIDFDFFDAEEIESVLLYSYFPVYDTVDTSDIFRIKFSKNITLNNNPMYLYYDPRTYSIAGMSNITTMMAPEGTGQTDNIFSNYNTIKIGDTYSLNFYWADTQDEVNGVSLDIVSVYPAPALGGDSVTFTHLPPLCEINIFDVYNSLIETISNNSSQYAVWNFDSDSNSGFYTFQINHQEITNNFKGIIISAN